MAEIALQEIQKHFGDTLAINNLELTIGDGELVVLLGPSGAGKTTTLRLIAGLEEADSGSIRINGVDMTKSHLLKEMLRLFSSNTRCTHT